MSSGPGHDSRDPVMVAIDVLAVAQPGALVVDVGGGSGTRAVPLAARGCRVLVVDSSTNALAILRRRAADAGVAERIEAVQADAERLAAVLDAESADLVLCHHLLEEVDDPAAALAAVRTVLKPDGAVSVVAASRCAAVLGQASAGRYEQARQILVDPVGRYGSADPLRRRFDVAGLHELLVGAGLAVESMSGVGVVAALLSASTRAGDGPGGAELDRELADHPVFREIGTDLHAIARKAPLDRHRSRAAAGVPSPNA